MTWMTEKLHRHLSSQNLCLQEVQNGRLFRLLAKLGTINERPE